MAYVKLDTNILDSTLWVDRLAREVFVTSLLMAEPREFSDPVPQISVRSLDLTGWEAPSGWYGYVPAAGIGIIRRAGVDTEAGLDALDRLGNPEPDSRSPEYEGRRMIRVDGGFVVLNYMRYRDYDHSAADRMRRLRARKKAASVAENYGNVTANGDGLSRIAEDIRHKTEDSKNKKKNTTAASEPDWLIDMKAIYPKRAGDQDWPRALRNGKKRIESGHTANEMLDGARRYAEYVRATGSEGTQFVKQAASFIGSGDSKPFLDTWDWPRTKADNRTRNNLTAAASAKQQLIAEGKL